jgi:hypothetical protein
MKPFHAAILALVLCAASASAAYWQSEDFDCSIDLPDGQSATKQTNWTTFGSTEEGTLVGAGRQDRSAYVFVGYVDLAKRKNFHLNPKTIEELETRYFGSGQGFRRDLKPISIGGMPGYRLTGDSVYQGAHYGLVVDMFEANHRIYQIAGMKENEPHPLKDPDIRSAMASFKLLSR